MGGFMDPFVVASPAWPQDSAGGSSATHAIDFYLRNGSMPTFMAGGGGSGEELGGGTVLSSMSGKLHDDDGDDEEELLRLLLQSDGGLDIAVDDAGTLDSILGAPVKNESEQSGAFQPQFLLAEQPAAYEGIIPNIAGEETSTQSFGFGSISDGDDQNNNSYQHHLLPPPAQPQLLQEFTGGLHHLDLSSLLVPPPVAAPLNTTGGNSAAPKPRARARRGQATDPHSIAERLRREKISDRMKNLQELVPNANKTDKASMLEEIIEYIKFLQLQTKVLSMSRLGSTESVVPPLSESQNKSSSGLLVSPRSRQHGGGGEELFVDGGAMEEQEIAELMENNMTAAMQYLQSRGLCLMPIALASAISNKKGTSPTE